MGGAIRVATYLRVWLLVVAALVLLQRIDTLSRPLTYAHAWAVAQSAVEAQAYLEIGFARLKGVPYPNHPPLGVHPEGYVRWPPIPSASLAAWFAVWGGSEASIHGYALAVQLLTAGLLYWMLWLLTGHLGAAGGLLTWLTLPVSMHFGHGVFHQNVGLGFAVLAAAAYLKFLQSEERRSVWLAIGVGGIVFAVLSSWEFAILPLGLLAGALWNRDRRQRNAALIYLAATIGAAAAVLIWYSVAFPGTLSVTLASIQNRLGLPMTVSGDGPMGLLNGWIPQETRLQALPTALRNILWQIGLPGWAAVVMFCWWKLSRWRDRKEGESLVLFCGLMAPALVWFAVFVNHVAIHEFMTLLAGPAVAFASAECVVMACDYLEKRGTQAGGWVLAAMIPLVLVVPLLRDIYHTFDWHGRSPGEWLTLRAALRETDDYVELGRGLGERTPPGSVILTPEANAVPIYYSRRHVIGGAASDEIVQKVLPAIRAEFPGAPIYLAFFARPRYLRRFPAYGGEWTGKRFVIVRLGEGAR